MFYGLWHGAMARRAFLWQIDNPTVTFFANGSLLMLGRGGDPKREASSDGVITAPSWRGPYTMHSAVGTARGIWIDADNAAVAQITGQSLDSHGTAPAQPQHSDCTVSEPSLRSDCTVTN